jgi:uncharacterized YccA/Bax inhibitor family protein
MTAAGTYVITGLLFVIVVAAAAFGWSQVEIVPVGGREDALTPAWTWLAFLLTFIVAIVDAFAYRAAPLTSVLFALGEGSLLGFASRYYDLRFDGIVSQALIATLCIFLAVYLLYSLRIVKVTSRFATGVIAATGGFFLLYMVVWLLSLLGVGFYFLYASTPLGIAISVGIVILGALNLTLGFAFVEKVATAGAPRFMQWYGAFGLMLSLIWIYVSVLRLLPLLRARQLENDAPTTMSSSREAEMDRSKETKVAVR